MPPRSALSIGCLCILSACATPRDACIRDASAAYQAAVSEQTRIARDLDRGYTYETDFERVQFWDWCRSGTRAPYRCLRRETRPVTKRVPVNRAELTNRLTAISAELPRMRQTAEASVRDCAAAFPAEET